MNFKIFPILLVIIALTSCQKDPLENPEDIKVIVDGELNNSALPPNEKTTSGDPIIQWVFQMQSSTGLVASTENSDFTSLYDNALAALLFVEIGQKGKAERIFDYYTTIMDSELDQNGGFYQFRKSDGSEPERIWMGDNAWLLIALNHYKDVYGLSKYDELTLKLEFWMRSLQQEDGSLLGGINTDGTAIPKVTEGMLMAFNAVKGYDDFHKNLLSFLANNRWNNELGILMAWPENPEYAFALDVLTLSKGIFSDMSDDVLFQANRFLNEQTLTLSGDQITGYCFDDDKDVIWLEGTSQMALAFNDIERFDLAEKLLKDLEKSLIKSSITPEAKGIPYTSNFGTSYGPSLLWDHTDISPTLSSSIWYAFAKMKFNPLHLGRKNKIPDGDKFWMLRGSI
ncbi:hypothetical protein ACOCEA_02165 [Maribacter sp. CXY002]|uniref:hypothetical protein n=1 Tax=Maribacter luteocoastalis TaxID=3407671 RepID=UPI003B67116C